MAKRGRKDQQGSPTPKRTPKAKGRGRGKTKKEPEDGKMEQFFAANQGKKAKTKTEPAELPAAKAEAQLKDVKMEEPSSPAVRDAEPVKPAETAEAQPEFEDVKMGEQPSPAVGDAEQAKPAETAEAQPKFEDVKMGEQPSPAVGDAEQAKPAETPEAQPKFKDVQKMDEQSPPAVGDAEQAKPAETAGAQPKFKDVQKMDEQSPPAAGDAEQAKLAETAEAQPKDVKMEEQSPPAVGDAEQAKPFETAAAAVKRAARQEKNPDALDTGLWGTSKHQRGENDFTQPESFDTALEKATLEELNKQDEELDSSSESAMPDQPAKEIDYNEVSLEVDALSEIWKSEEYSIEYEVWRASKHLWHVDFKVNKRDLLREEEGSDIAEEWDFGAGMFEELENDLYDWIHYYKKRVAVEQDPGYAAKTKKDPKPEVKPPRRAESSGRQQRAEADCRLARERQVDKRVSSETAAKTLSDALQDYPGSPGKEDIMSTTACVMAAILLKNHSADESSKLVSNLLTLPKDMTCGSACSGTGAFEDALAHALNALNMIFGLSLSAEASFACESIDWKRDFVAEVCGDECCIFEDVTKIGDPEARRCATHEGGKCNLPSVHGFGAGFSCTSYSKLNKDCKKNADAMRKAEDGNPEGMVASVNTFDGCVQILDISKPDWAVLENVPSIENQEEDSESNLQMCVDKLREKGYSVQCVLLDSSWYGLPQSRKRVYLICVSLFSPNLSINETEFFQNVKAVLRSLYMDPPLVDQFLLSEKNPAVKRYYEWLEESVKDANEGKSAWKSMHMQVAEKRSIVWPLQIPKAVSASKWFSVLTARAKEVVGFAADDRFRAKKNVTYADVYHSATRYSVGPASTLPIILPRSQIWTFGRQRLLLGRELLRCQGLSYHDDVLNEYPESKLCNLAGNAFSGNVILAVIFAILASLRYYSVSELSENEYLTEIVSDLTNLGGSRGGDSENDID